MEGTGEIFRKETRQWFAREIGQPTRVQEEAWPFIAAGRHTLVSAPTGTGKTLAAFLVFLDRLMGLAQEDALPDELQVIYISPLKSLASDIRENLKRPLEGLSGQEKIRTAVRTGDTPQKERQRMLKRPPHILITTPESLYLMLTSAGGKKLLHTAKAVILDELHALIDTKRGAHLMLSLARLDALCQQPLQRIGLSATIEPLDAAARYLAPERVEIAAPPMKKMVKLVVESPFTDADKRHRDPVWEELAGLVYRHCQENRSTLAFVEGRRYAEKLAFYVNRLGGEDFARVHHGSLSKEQREEAEAYLRAGRLRLLCATSSMELGIDVGQIDQVLQVGCPRTVSGTMQRLGRAGHNPGRVSVMYLFPRTAAECVTCGMTAQLAREGGIERVKPPSGCLDVLAQHLVSMAAGGGYTLDEVMLILSRAWPFRDVTKEDVKAVLAMLAGDYEHDRDIPVRPRVLYDRIHERVEGDGYSRLLAVTAGGTIPDRGLYAVQTEEGVKLGEVDEEFVFESREGDRFLLGSFGWKIVRIERDRVTVTRTEAQGARLPFWKGEIRGRDKQTGEAFGRMLGSLNRAQEENRLEEALGKLGLSAEAADLAAGYLKRQITAVGSLPDDKTILIEHFRDSSGNAQAMIHSVFGRRINTPLSLLLQRAAQRGMKSVIGSVDEEEGILLYAYAEAERSGEIPEGLLWQIDPSSCRDILSAILPATPLFNMAFRYNSGRALMMGIRKKGRQPLWLQRLKGAELLDRAVLERRHPLMRETMRECLEDLWDIKGLEELLEDIRAGVITVREIHTGIPSPMSFPLRWAQEAAVMYDYAPSTGGIQRAAAEDLLRAETAEGKIDAVSLGALPGSAFSGGILPGDILSDGILPGGKELLSVQEHRRLPENENQLHALLMTEGDLAAGELEIPASWLESLAGQGRVLCLEQGLWIAAEQEEQYRLALEDGDREEMAHIVRRMLRYRGAATARQTAERYGIGAERAEDVLALLLERKEAVRQEGYGDRAAGDISRMDPENILYFHAKLYQRAIRRTLQNRREEIDTSPAESYAAILAQRLETSLPAGEAVENTLRLYAGRFFPAAAWEGIILPRRAAGYRENLLDRYLAEGELFWHMDGNGELCFSLQEEIDWEADLSGVPETLSGNERLVYEALLKRGASFMQALNSVLKGESAYDPLLSLMEKGLVYADSFVPVRQWLERKKTAGRTARQRAGIRVKAMQAGRWDVVRPCLVPSMDALLDQGFRQNVILCRETAGMWLPGKDVLWKDALRALSIREYTGQARRGYFVEGMSGAQFMDSAAFAGQLRVLRRPSRQIIWVNAADPAQVWGKAIPHREGRSFANVPGTLVALRSGRPVMLLERQGRGLRVWEEDAAAEGLLLFASLFASGRLYPGLKRVVVKEYPQSCRDALQAAGFLREMQDYVLYR